MPLLRQGFGRQGRFRQDNGVASSAFTLLEVIVALAIFALAAVVLGAAYVNILNAYAAVARGNQADEDLRFARAQLLAEPDRTKAETGGDFAAGDGRTVKWHATIAATATADLFTVTFTCERPDAADGGTRATTEQFMLLRPTWADPAENTKLKQDAQDRIAALQGKPKT